MKMEVSKEERDLVENYRKSGEADKEAVRWAAEVAARVRARRQEKAER